MQQYFIWNICKPTKQHGGTTQITEIDPTIGYKSETAKRDNLLMTYLQIN